MKIGKIDFSDKLKSLSYTNFKKYYEKGGFKEKTGLCAESAAEKLGIKTPSTKKKKEGD